MSKCKHDWHYLTVLPIRRCKLCGLTEWIGAKTDKQRITELEKEVKHIKQLLSLP